MRFAPLVCVIAIWTSLAAHARWEQVSTTPESVRAIVVSRTWSVVGFTATSTTQSLFASKTGSAITALPLAATPEFYAYAHDAVGTRLCLAVSRADTRRLVCYGVDGRQLADLTLPVPMTSGALTDENTLWVVDPSGTTAPRRVAMVELHRTASGWVEQRRVQSPLCRPNDSDHDCSELELHPLAQHSLGIIPLLGRFEGTQFRYPSVAIWNAARGATKTIDMPSTAVPEALRAQYRAIGERPLRLIYRSAASASGKVAVVPVLPSDEKHGVRRDQLWLYDGGNTWHRISAPAPINAVTFVGEQPVIVTESGEILKWAP